jgi:hypothetical protein
MIFVVMMMMNVVIDIGFYEWRLNNLNRWVVIREGSIIGILVGTLLVQVIDL